MSKYSIALDMQMLVVVPLTATMVRPKLASRQTIKKLFEPTLTAAACGKHQTHLRIKSSGRNEPTAEVEPGHESASALEAAAHFGDEEMAPLLQQQVIPHHLQLDVAAARAHSSEHSCLSSTRKDVIPETQLSPVMPETQPSPITQQ